jgi:small neutral amino acid transporter SnatA (MarC family)
MDAIAAFIGCLAALIVMAEVVVTSKWLKYVVALLVGLVLTWILQWLVHWLARIVGSAG